MEKTLSGCWEASFVRGINIDGLEWGAAFVTQGLLNDSVYNELFVPVCSSVCMFLYVSRQVDVSFGVGVD